MPLFSYLCQILAIFLGYLSKSANVEVRMSPVKKILYHDTSVLLVRRSVGISTAAFVLAVLEGSTQPGVWFPEEVHI